MILVGLSQIFASFFKGRVGAITFLDPNFVGSPNFSRTYNENKFTLI